MNYLSWGCAHSPWTAADVAMAEILGCDNHYCHACLEPLIVGVSFWCFRPIIPGIRAAKCRECDLAGRPFNEGEVISARLRGSKGN